MTTHKKPIILCVDDEKIVLTSLKTELKEAFGDYIIETAEGGEQAFEIYVEMYGAGYEIPLVLSDYIMPDLKGDELLIRIHGLSRRTRKIMLTGQATLEGISNAINNAKLYRYIAKPWEPNDFVLTVREALHSYYQEKKLEEQNEELKEMNLVLEEKVRHRTKVIKAKNELLELHKKEIVDSIYYAKRIQDGMLKTEDSVVDSFPPHFILFKPKDIVSGDFYWALEKQGHLFLTVADCTGHGVPGAFLTILGASMLNEINAHDELLTPAEILDKLRDRIIKELSQSKEADTLKDGMDMSIVRLNLETKQLIWAGANNPLWVVRNQKEESPVLDEYRPHRQPIAYYPVMTPFENHIVDLSTGDVAYLFSDGYMDQFGGPHDRRFMKKRFKELLLTIQSKSMEEQKEKLDKTIMEWKGGEEQLDDILIIGVRFA